MIEISASILGANIMQLGKDIETAIESGIDRIHIDIMDGNYVENISFGSNIISAIDNLGYDIPLDIHLMTNCTESMVRQCLKFKPDTIAFHPKTAPCPKSLAATINNEGVSAVIAINPDEQISEFDSIIADFDEVLLMSVIPGACGKTFMPEVLVKVAQIRKHFSGAITIDGGIRPETCILLKKLAINRIVAGSALFGGNIANNVFAFAKACNR